VKQHRVFKIDEKDFYCDIELLSAQSFVVQSVPRPYQVTLASGSTPFTVINQLLAQNPKNLLLIDANVLQLHQSQLECSPHMICEANATETFKTLEGVTSVLDFLQKNKFTKGERLIVVGGGIIQDVGAFVGAVYKRGIPWIHFPTTLLSMCDSCIGGKTGINYNGAKNQLALFSAPYSVVINPGFLKTLTKEAINSGLGEMLKLCITGGEYFLDLYEKHVQMGVVVSDESFQQLIMAALCVKKAIVEEDEFELNHRRSLNYGHTLGHAIEVLSDYVIPHGQAVAVGVALVNELSCQYGLLGAEELSRLNQLCYHLLDTSIMQALENISLDHIITLLQKDKKTEGKMIHFVFMKTVGDTRFVKLALDDRLLSNIQLAFKRILAHA